MKVKPLIFAMFFFCLIGLASPICINDPGSTAEGVPVCASIPGLGDKVILPGVGAGYVAIVRFEDLDATRTGKCMSGLAGDCDFFDINVRIVRNHITGRVTIEHIGDSSAYFNNVGWINGGPLVNQNTVGPQEIPVAPGFAGELILQDINGVGNTWFTGDASRNADGTKHAIVTSLTMFWDTPPQAPVPEPATYGMMGLGLVSLGIIARRRKPGQAKTE